MSRFVSIAKVAFRGQPVAAAVKFAVRQPASFLLARNFSADHGHGHAAAAGKDDPFLDVKDVTDRIMEVIKNFEKVNASKLSPVARFKEDLDLDSLDAVEVVFAIEEEFAIEIPDSEADKILSISDAVAYVSNHPMAK